MSGSFLFTRNTAGRHGGASHVQPLLRAANHNIDTFDGAVQDAVANQLVTVDGKTIYMQPDVAFMMIGRKSELRKQVAADDMPYLQIRSATTGTELSLYRMQYKPSMKRTDHIYVLAGPVYWNNTQGADLSRVNISDLSNHSYGLDLGSHTGPKDPDRGMIIRHINSLKN